MVSVHKQLQCHILLSSPATVQRSEQDHPTSSVLSSAVINQLFCSLLSIAGKLPGKVFLIPPEASWRISPSEDITPHL